MNTDDGCDVAEMLPHEVYEVLKQPGSALVDVRTKAERSFVGVPDFDALRKRALSIEWLAFPELSVNPEFTGDLFSKLGDMRSKMQCKNVNRWKQRQLPWRQT